MLTRRSRGPLRFWARVPPLALLGLACLGGNGCGGGDSSTPAAPETRQLDVPVQAPDSPQALTARPVEGSFRGINFQDYSDSVNEILSLLNEYWAAELPKTFGTKYAPPSDVIAYYPDQGLPKCGGKPLDRKNASYCPANDTVAWDEPGLMIPFYTQVGDAAVGFVIAHEWGHLIQHELDAKFPLTIESELNADCLAGAFAGGLYNEGLIQGGTGLKPGTDLAEAAEGIFRVGDNPGTPWQDPDAHGTADQRLQAFETGFDGGPEACAKKLGPGFTQRL